VSTFAPTRRLQFSRRLFLGLVAFAGLSLALSAESAEANGDGGKGVVVRTMTYNAGLGTGLSARFATTLDELCEGAGQNIGEVDATNPPLRMRAIARNILRKKPDLVGLNEADAVLTQTPADHGPLLGGTSATTVRYDYIQLILDRLNKGKRRYRLVTAHDEFEFEVKANLDGVGFGCDDSETDVRLITRNAILKRVRAGVRTSRLRQQSYRHQVSFELLGGIQIPVPRGWESVDASVRGSKRFRFVHTHLEAFDNRKRNTMLDTRTDPPTQTMVGNGAVRTIQADELVQGPAQARIPVVLAGDLNSNVPGVDPGDEKAFQRILAAGFKRRSTQEPPSCCIEDDRGGTIADFDHVVDHILAKPGRTIRLVSSSVVGRRKVNGLFPSDHAGVFSALRVPRKPVALRSSVAACRVPCVKTGAPRQAHRRPGCRALPPIAHCSSAS
jgi:endonuclease/exonuclease/phosphatase family metal-dependent hydrolase